MIAAHQSVTHQTNDQTIRKKRPRPAPRAATSTRAMPSSKRGGQRSHSGADGPTYDQLYAEARRRRTIRGRSSMNKAELMRKLGR